MNSTIVRRICLAAVLMTLVCFTPIAQAAEPSSADCGATAGELWLAGSTEASYEFEGCWTFWAAGPCFDIYRDSSGGYWQCKLCGTTSNPGPGQCTRTTIQTLNTGYWCS